MCLSKQALAFCSRRGYRKQQDAIPIGAMNQRRFLMCDGYFFSSYIVVALVGSETPGSPYTRFNSREKHGPDSAFIDGCLYVTSSLRSFVHFT